MIVMKCTCEKAEHFGSGMSPQPCEGCDECGSQYGGKPGIKPPMEPHDFETRYHNITGKPYKQCKNCHHRDNNSYQEAKVV